MKMGAAGLSAQQEKQLTREERWDQEDYKGLLASAGRPSQPCAPTAFLTVKP